MFVNDTNHLPEYGRVCVAGFRALDDGARNYYSISISNALAEVSVMTAPRNQAAVLGVGAEIESVKGPTFAAYFAASRDRFDTGPNYKESLFVLVDGAVYSVASENIGTTIRRGFTTREFTLLREDRPQRTVEYPWPWYREPFASADPADARTRDFLRAMDAMVRVYAPH